MIFSSLQFFVFFIVFFPLFLLLKNRGKVFFVFLLAASYYFYMNWVAPFIIVLVFTTVMDFFFGKMIGRTDNRKVKKGYIVASIVLNLLLLCFFKYLNFFIGNYNGLVALLHLRGGNLPMANFGLPVGISFFTFKSMSYTVDIYKGKIKPEPDFLKFATFVGFFPELVMGPIVRAEKMIPQFYRPVRPTAAKFTLGLKLFLTGFFKKLFIADMISPYSDNVFAHYTLFTGYQVWVGVIAYTIQLYCDFSGYTDMAIGIAKMMDYDFPENFNLPYNSKSITEFWQRWHMSLSAWLRDYLYIPLGGNRKGRLRTDANLLLTMLIGGLWHGSSWTFVFWGGLHGIYLVVHKQWLAAKKKLGWEGLDTFFMWNAFAQLVTLLVVVIAWVYFRAQSFEAANAILLKMTQLKIADCYFIPQVAFLVSLVVASHILYPYVYDKDKKFRGGWFLEATLYAFMFLMLLLLAPTNTSPFLYFQF